MYPRGHGTPGIQRQYVGALTIRCSYSGGGVRIRSGTHKEAGQCDIIVISAGAKQRHGKERSFDMAYSHMEIVETFLTAMAGLSII